MAGSAPTPQPGEEGSDMSSRRQFLGYIQQELTEYRPEIHDDELREAVNEFLIKAADVPMATAREFISAELADLRKDNDMMMGPGVRDASEAFPEECEGCEHYGINCPIMTDRAQVERRKAIMEETQDPDQLRYLLREYATDNSCDVLLDRLERISQNYGPLVREGQLLLLRVEDELLWNDESEAVMRAMASEEALADAVDRDTLERLKEQADGEVAVDGEADADRDGGGD